jgi:subtilisin family serine protease
VVFDAGGIVFGVYDSPPCMSNFVVRDCQGGTCAYYQYLQGTSMASPHAVGVAALIVSQFGKPDGGTNQVGETFRNPAYAATLRAIAAGGPRTLLEPPLAAPAGLAIEKVDFRRGADGAGRIVVRINDGTTPWFDADLALLGRAGVRCA